MKDLKDLIAQLEKSAEAIAIELASNRDVELKTSKDGELIKKSVKPRKF